MADIDQAESIGECVILGDSLGYQGLNARSAKETLQQRTTVLEEYQAAVKTAISKRRGIERLKASSNIRPERVDEALEDLEEVGACVRVHWDVFLTKFVGKQVRTNPGEEGRWNFTESAPGA
jgi:predicted metal-dependent peptidase